MDLVQIIIIAIVQGITEWIPVSSSGHVALLDNVFKLNLGIGFNVAVHLGTLIAVLVYFSKDIFRIVSEFVAGKWEEGREGRLGWYLIIATIPAAIAGFLLKDLIEGTFYNLFIIGFGFLITSLLLFRGSITRGNKKINGKKAFYIGLFQIVSLLPGISRSGSTISGGLLQGLDEKHALKFSFLMSIPIILGAGFLDFISGSFNFNLNIGIAIFFAFIVGLITIHFLYTKILIHRKNLKWFAIYALLIGILSLVLGFYGF